MSSKRLYLVELNYRVYAWAESEDLARDTAVDAIASLDVPYADEFVEIATAVHYGDEDSSTVGEPPSDLPSRATLEEIVKLQKMDLAEERRLVALREEFARRQKGLF